MGPALAHQAPEVAGQRQLRSSGLRLRCRGHLGLERGGHVLAPGPELGLIFSRHAEQMADDRDRERQGQSVDQVEAGCAVGCRQQPAGDVADPRLESGDDPSA